MWFRQVKSLILQESIIEWRLRYAINGILLYLASVIFISYLSFRSQLNSLNPVIWNTLFWIIILFTAVNAVTKSFIQLNRGRLIYLYSIADPMALIISKMLYNSLLLVGIGLTGYIMYGAVLGNPVADHLLFMINLILGAIGFSAVLTMNSGIASKAANSTSLMAILSFPVVLPLLLIIIRISKNAMDGLSWSASYNQLIYLVAIDIIVITLSIILFPYIWRS
jgi:heme exporter protein B